MMSHPENLSVIIGTSSRAEGLRRHLRKSGFANLGVAMSVAGLRREMIAGQNHLTIACVLLDEQTLELRGEELKRLIADSNNFNSAFRCIGLVTSPSLLPISFQLGCHYYVSDTQSVAPSIHSLTAHWRQTNRLSRFSDISNDGGPHRPLNHWRNPSPPSDSILPNRRYDFPVDQSDRFGFES